ncbi:MAG: hypothetical protein EOM11_09995 [Erysipelotrichia bacterium]|nr:hypothetical protein [Erysipelotrichia bacterium]
MKKATNFIKALHPIFWVGAVTCRKLLVRLRYKRRMSKLMKSYRATCHEMAWLQEKAPNKLKMKWAFQQRRIKIYDRYLSIYGR